MSAAGEKGWFDKSDKGEIRSFHNEIERRILQKTADQMVLSMHEIYVQPSINKLKLQRRHGLLMPGVDKKSTPRIT